MQLGFFGAAGTVTGSRYLLDTGEKKILMDCGLFQVWSAMEAMACGGISFLGATGEDYATPGFDAISLQTSSPSEIVGQLLYLHEHPDLAKRLQHEARRTAARFTWDKVMRAHIGPMLSSPRPSCARSTAH